MFVIRPILITLCMVLPAVSVYFCKEDDIAETVKFEKEPECLPPSKAPERVRNGTVYLFKPNFQRTEIDAYKCQKHIVRTMTARDCGFWICAGDSVPQHDYYTESVSIDVCKKWIERNSCDECLKEPNTRASSCAFKKTNPSTYETDAPVRVEYESNVAFGVARWHGDTVNCAVSKGKVTLKRPWNTIASSWGTLLTDLEHGRYTDNRYSNLADRGYRDEQKTVVWTEDIGQMQTCSYKLHIETGGFIISFSNEINGNEQQQLVLPDQQVLFTISDADNIIEYYGNSSQYGCLDQSIATGIDGAEVFALPGDMIAVFIENDIDGDIVFGGENQTNVPIHGHVTDNGFLQVVNDTNTVNATVKGGRQRRDTAEVLDAVAAFQESKLAYFINLLSKHQYDTTIQLLENLCQKTLQLFALWKIHAEVSPSAVVSHLLGRDVMVKREDDHFNIMACMSIAEEDYEILPSMRDPNNVEKCYSRPLIKMKKNPQISFQLGKENRLITPPIYFEKCTPKPNVTAYFRIDEKVIQFVNYLKNENFSGYPYDNVLVLSPKVSDFFDVEQQFYNVKHVTLYDKGEVSVSLIDGEEVMDYMNQELNIRAKYGNRRYSQFEDKPSSSEHSSEILIFFGDIMSHLIFFFSNPISQILAIIFILIPTFFNWFRLFYSCCKRPKVTIFAAKRGKYTKLPSDGNSVSDDVM